MAVYLSLTAVVLIVALLIRQEKTPYENSKGQILYRGMSRQQLINVVGCLIIFVLLFLVSALRLNVGNDYLNYVEFMHLVYSRAYVPTEVAFIHCADLRIIFWFLLSLPFLQYFFS